MKSRTLALAALLPLVQAGPALAADAAKGKVVYESATPKCTSCHTDTKNPLAKTAAENTPEELKAWVRTPKEMLTKKGKKGMMPAYPAAKISDADLEALVAYLGTMK